MILISVESVSGNSKARTPWKDIASATESFVDPQYLPENFVLQEPTKLVEFQLDRLLNHWYDRQANKHWVFAFKGYKTKGGNILPPVTGLLNSNRKPKRGEQEGNGKGKGKAVTKRARNKARAVSTDSEGERFDFGRDSDTDSQSDGGSIISREAKNISEDTEEENRESIDQATISASVIPAPHSKAGNVTLATDASAPGKPSLEGTAKPVSIGTTQPVGNATGQLVSTPPERAQPVGADPFHGGTKLMGSTVQPEGNKGKQVTVPTLDTAPVHSPVLAERTDPTQVTGGITAPVGTDLPGTVKQRKRRTVTVELPQRNTIPKAPENGENPPRRGAPRKPTLSREVNQLREVPPKMATRSQKRKEVTPEQPAPQKRTRSSKGRK